MGFEFLFEFGSMGEPLDQPSVMRLPILSQPWLAFRGSGGCLGAWPTGRAE